MALSGPMIMPVLIQVKAPGVQGTTQSVATGMNNIDKAASGAAGSLRNLAGAFTSIVVAQKLAGGLRAVVEASATLDFALKGVQVQANLTAAEYGKLKAAAMDAGDATIYTPQQAADSLRELTRATGDAGAATGVLNQAMLIAQNTAGKLQPALAAKHVGEFARSFGLIGEKAAMLPGELDKVYVAAKKLGVPMEDVTKIFGRLGVAATRGNQSLESMVSTFMLARSAGLSSMRVSTQLIRIFGELGKEKAVRAFQSLGIAVKDALTGDLMQAPELFMRMFEQFQKNAGNLKGTLKDAFGEAAIKPIFAILGQMKIRGPETFRILQQAMANASGTISKDGKAMMNTTQGALLQLTASFENFKAVLGDSIAPAVSAVAKLFKGVLDVIRFLIDMPVVGGVLKIGIGFAVLRVAAVALQGVLYGAGRIWKVFADNLRESNTVLNTVSTALTTVRTKLLGVSTATVAAAAESKAFGHQFYTAMYQSSGAASMLGRSLMWVKTNLWALLGTAGIGILLAYGPKLLGILKELGASFLEFAQAGVVAFATMLSPALDDFLHKMQYGTAKAAKAAMESIQKSGLHGFVDALSGGGYFLGMKAAVQMKIAAEQRAHDEKLAKEAAMQQKFIFGTKQFDEAVTRLEKLFKVKPAIIKQSGLELHQKNIADALATAKKGGWFSRGGARMKLDKPGDVAMLQRAQDEFREAQRLLAIAQTRELKGTEQQRMNTAMQRSWNIYQSIAPMDKTGRKSFMSKVIDPLMAMQKPAYRNAMGHLLEQRAGKSFITGKPLAGYSPFGTRPVKGLGDEIRAAAEDSRTKGVPSELGGKETGLDLQKHLLGRYKDGKGLAGSEKTLLTEIAKGVHKNHTVAQLLQRLVELQTQLNEKVAPKYGTWETLSDPAGSQQPFNEGRRALHNKPGF